MIVGNLIVIIQKARRDLLGIDRESEKWLSFSYLSGVVPVCLQGIRRLVGYMGNADFDKIWALAFKMDGGNSTG